MKFRWKLKRSKIKAHADRPPARAVLFEHVPKTGGSQIVAVLRRLFPHHIVSPHVSFDATGDLPAGLERWRILCGHIGRRHHHRIADLDDRALCTVLRDPVSRIRSCYTFWRWNIQPGHPHYPLPHMVAARTLAFREFVRTPLITANLGHAQFFHLSGRMPEGEPAAAASTVLDDYRLVGTQEDIPGFLERLLELLEVRSPVPVAALLSPEDANASLHRFEVDPADRAYIEERAAFERALFEEARRRSVHARPILAPNWLGRPVPLPAVMARRTGGRSST